MSLWYLFFFSSRRRHTRLQGDWSSDVCSSDLHGPRRRISLGKKSQGRMALRVHVHEQHSSLLVREKGRNIDGCDGLSTSALLVHDRYRAHTRSFWCLCVLSSFTRVDSSKRLGQIATNP